MSGAVLRAAPLVIDVDMPDASAHGPISASRRLQFCAGHRVCDHESVCRNLHGHNYVLWIHARAVGDRKTLDSAGRVIDFAVLKRLIGGWIEEHWDHGFLLWAEDPLLALWSSEHGGDAAESAVLEADGGHKLFVLPANPTAENLASFLLTEVCPKLLVGTGVEVHRIELYETENCMASAALADGRARASDADGGSG